MGASDDTWLDDLAAQADGPSLPLKLHLVHGSQFEHGTYREPEIVPCRVGLAWAPEALRYFGRMVPRALTEARRLRSEFWTDGYVVQVLRHHFPERSLDAVFAVLAGEDVGSVARAYVMRRGDLKLLLRAVRHYVREELYPREDGEQGEQSLSPAAEPRPRRDELETARAARFAVMTVRERVAWRAQKRAELGMRPAC